MDKTKELRKQIVMSLSLAQLEEVDLQGEIVIEKEATRLSKLVQQREVALINKIEELIKEESAMFFSDEIPFFDNLPDYMDHVAKIRKKLRSELREALNKLKQEME